MRLDFNKILACIYAVLLFLAFSSLSVPPHDLLLFGIVFLVAAIGLLFGWKKSKRWRLAWMAALVIAIVGGLLDVTASKRIREQRSRVNAAHQQ